MVEEDSPYEDMDGSSSSKGNNPVPRGRVEIKFVNPSSDKEPLYEPLKVITCQHKMMLENPVEATAGSGESNSDSDSTYNEEDV